VTNAILCDMSAACACIRIYCIRGHRGAGKRVHFVQHCARGTAHTFFASCGGGCDAPDFSPRGTVFESRLCYSFPDRHLRDLTHSL